MDQRTITISAEKARRVAVYAQGLGKTFPFGKGKNGVLNTIRTLGYIQIDTISVIERAHHHVLWTRVPNYQKIHLHTLQKKEKKIFEHWGHAMSYLPMEDFRFTLPIKKYFQNHFDPWPKSDNKIKAFVLDRIHREGPLMAKDFERKDKKTGAGWWDWKPAKLALERLYYEGNLVVTHRQGFQKVYDIPERALPDNVDLTEPSQSEYARFLILRATRALGLASAKSISYLRKGMAKAVQTEIRNMVEERLIVPIKVKKTQSLFYSQPDLLDQGFSIQRQIRFLSPFDNLVIQRGRLLELFNFNYQIECYVPAAKRKFGYFSLPILFGTEIIGRSDMKADRKTGILHINNIILEDRIKVTEEMLAKLGKSIRKFATFHLSENIKLHECKPPLLANYLKPIINSESSM